MWLQRMVKYIISKLKPVSIEKRLDDGCRELRKFFFFFFSFFFFPKNCLERSLRLIDRNRDYSRS